MIDIKELREGNVTSLGVITKVNHPSVVVNNITPAITEAINPVVLTVDWLKRWGFTENTPNAFTSADGMLTLYRTSARAKTFYQALVPKPTGVVKHVHSLQNLYFEKFNSELIG